MNNSLRNSNGLGSMLNGLTNRRGLAWGVIIIGALLAFEIFNFSTTQFALADVLGPLKFAGVTWSTILAIAFCGIDFAGIARLFTPEKGRDEPAEVWYLFGAWLLAAAMNATLTWWGVSVAIVDHKSLAGGVVISGTTLIKVVPIFVAIMVWLIRVMVIGSFSIAGERLFSQGDSRSIIRGAQSTLQPASAMASHRPSSMSSPYRPAAKVARPDSSAYTQHNEPTYHNLSLGAKPAREAEYIDNPRNS